MKHWTEFKFIGKDDTVITHISHPEVHQITMRSYRMTGDISPFRFADDVIPETSDIDWSGIQTSSPRDDNGATIDLDIAIGRRSDGSAYYVRDLAAELHEVMATLDWAENHVFDTDAMGRGELSEVAALAMKSISTLPALKARAALFPVRFNKAWEL